LVTIREIFAKNVLTKTAIEGYDYCINPYVGCAHGCRYCYATFMKRFTGHMEPWGEFVDVKVNAPEVLYRQLRRARKGSVLIGTVTDPYQPVEKHYRITRGCIEALLERQFSMNILTRSPLVVRDIDLFKQFEDIAVGLSITTDREDIRKIFEPHSPSIRSRTDALKTLHESGIATYAFIGPILPLTPGKIFEMIAGIVDEVLIDRLNYSNKVKSLYRKAGLAQYLEDTYFIQTASSLKEGLEKEGIPVSVIF
jgi:DNA repair photolyase